MRRTREGKHKARANRLHLKEQPVICCRASTDSQWRNLDDQMDRLIHVAHRYTGGWTAIFDFIGPGNHVERWTDAAQLARERGVPILAESLDRLMRSSEYSLLNQDAPLTEEDWERYHRVFHDVEIVFLFKSNIRSHQTKRGNPGRPKGSRKQSSKGVTNATQDELNRAKSMWEQGMSSGGIGMVMGRHKQTIYYWSKQGFQRIV